MNWKSVWDTWNYFKDRQTEGREGEWKEGKKEEREEGRDGGRDGGRDDGQTMLTELWHIQVQCFVLDHESRAGVTDLDAKGTHFQTLRKVILTLKSGCPHPVKAQENYPTNRIWMDYAQHHITLITFWEHWQIKFRKDKFGFQLIKLRKILFLMGKFLKLPVLFRQVIYMMNKASLSISLPPSFSLPVLFSQRSKPAPTSRFCTVLCLP